MFSDSCSLLLSGFCPLKKISWEFEYFNGNDTFVTYAHMNVKHTKKSVSCVSFSKHFKGMMDQPN